MDNKNFKEDDYLQSSKYAGHGRSESNRNFSTFEHDGSYYFALLENNGAVAMRSEAYKTQAARDNGIASVANNMVIPERWHIVDFSSKHFLCLRAANNQEIAKSWAMDSKEDAEAYLKMILILSSDTDVLKPEDKEDDYLPTLEYEGHTVNDNENNVALFKHENGQYYFALYEKDGSVKLRSEGFETAKNRDQELSGVLKYHNDDSMYDMLEKGKFFMMVLRDKSGQEVGRSPLLKSEDHPSMFGISTSLGATAAGAAITGKILSETRKQINETRNITKETRKDLGEKSRKQIGETRNQITETRNALGENRSLLRTTQMASKADDYLACSAYRNHKVIDKKNNVAFFKGKDDQQYFAIYNDDGSVRLRSEGFQTTNARDLELKDALKYLNDKSKYEVIDKGEYHIKVLKNEAGQEVGRTCLTKGAAGFGVMAMAGIAAMAVSKFAAPAKKPIGAYVSNAGCLKFWPFLLLLPLLWFCWKGCGTLPPPPPPPPVVVTPPPPPVKEVVPVPIAIKTCDCSNLTHPVFVIPDGPAPKATTILGRAPEYGNSHNLDASGFYNKLKNRYESSEMERKFLDGIFKQMGYSKGFKDATADLFSEVTVPRGVSGNLGTKVTHKTVYRKLNTQGKDLLAFKIKAENACDLHFMKTCGNHFFYNDCE